jgi:CBS domain-containing protein
MEQRRYDGDYPTVATAPPTDINFTPPKSITAREIMSRNVISIGPEVSALEVVDLLSKHHITGVPVENKEGHLIGIVSEKDTFKLLLGGGFTQRPTGKVSDIMSKEVETVGPNDDVFFIADKFYHHNYRRLPVLEGGKVIGIISRRDILECIKKMGHA